MTTWTALRTRWQQESHALSNSLVPFEQGQRAMLERVLGETRAIRPYNGFFWEWMLDPEQARALMEGVDAMLVEAAGPPLRALTYEPPPKDPDMERLIEHAREAFRMPDLPHVGSLKMEIIEPPAPLSRVELDFPLAGQSFPGPAEMVAFLREHLGPFAARNPGYCLAFVSAPMVTGQEKIDAPETWPLMRVELVPREAEARTMLREAVKGSSGR